MVMAFAPSAGPTCSPAGVSGRLTITVTTPQCWTTTCCRRRHSSAPLWRRTFRRYWGGWAWGRRQRAARGALRGSRQPRPRMAAATAGKGGLLAARAACGSGSRATAYSVAQLTVLGTRLLRAACAPPTAASAAAAAALPAKCQRRRGGRCSWSCLRRRAAMCGYLTWCGRCGGSSWHATAALSLTTWITRSSAGRNFGWPPRRTRQRLAVEARTQWPRQRLLLWRRCRGRSEADRLSWPARSPPSCFPTATLPAANLEKQARLPRN
jgi:hypothetical protein